MQRLRHFSTGRVALATCICMYCASTALAARSAGDSSASDAPRLVQEALDAELAGDAARRNELLAKARTADPEYGPARWQNGQVKIDGQWRSIEEVQRAVSLDPRYQEYEALRQTSADNAEDQVALAEWCRDRGLTHQERYHWAMALLADPDLVEARQALGLQAYRDGLYTREQIALIESREKVSKRDFDRFTPRMAQLCRLATRGPANHRKAALDEIRGIREVDALNALDAAIENVSVKNEQHALDLQLAMVGALEGMPEHEATLRLLNGAVFSPLPEVREAAALALRSRPATDYVPLLMAKLRAPVEVDVSVLTAPDGTVRMVETITQEGPERDRALVRSTNYEVENAWAEDGFNERAGVALARNLNRAATAAERTQAQMDAANAATAESNERIEAALKTATGVESLGTPQLWWQAWQDFNELQTLDEEPVQMEFEERTETIDLAQTSHECFVAGTPVWTQSGLRPIELIMPGDMVLAQNPETGELDYRPVLQTTLGTPVPVVRIQLPKESITSTRGHRYWVNGRGWEMAKFLEPSMRLHALSGPLKVEAIEKAEPVPCHNLVVDDFHTYFVGKSLVLVHDRNCPRPATAGIPGSATRRSSLPVERPIQISLSTE